MPGTRVLLVDNYDSFTFNLAQALAVEGAEVEVTENDRVDLDRLGASPPAAVVLSPGPGNPWTPRDVGRCPALIARFAGRLPMLGVCLGHQLIGRAFGARVVRAERIMHGKTSRLHRVDHGLFEGVPSSFEAMRYHSWALRQQDLPEDVRALAWAEDGCLMAFGHRRAPLYGLQFHPESIGSPEGPRILGNFLLMAEERCQRGTAVLSHGR
ncbi:MAG: aminodeoxychorismate/anthranilate synthase component II [Myxococcota bacterium]